MSDLELKVRLIGLEAKAGALSKALEAQTNAIREIAHTLREWAVAAGGHAPSAIVASRLLELIGDESKERTQP